jgi:hypothetical protein
MCSIIPFLYLLFEQFLLFLRHILVASCSVEHVLHCVRACCHLQSQLAQQLRRLCHHTPLRLQRVQEQLPLIGLHPCISVKLAIIQLFKLRIASLNFPITMYLQVLTLSIYILTFFSKPITGSFLNF